METWTYLLKVNAAIAVFYMVYRWCYRNDTFFTLRRYLLQGILFLSVVYPFTDFSKWTASFLLYITATSRFPLFFMPAFTPDATNPFG